MISALMAMLATQAQVQAAPMTLHAAPVKAVTASQFAAPLTLQDRRQHLIAEGRALLDRARRMNPKSAAARGTPGKAEVDAAADQMKSELDSMSELGETESLRLQMAMDRLSKLMSTLSNMLKKADDTQQGIVQNMK